MSPTTPDPVLDTSGHPSVETIADHLEGLLPADAAEQLAAHFAECPECRDTRAALEEVRSLLGRTATPVLPDDIGIRIDAALAAEALLAAAPVAPAVPDVADVAGLPSVASSAPAGGPGSPAPSSPATRATGAPRPPSGPGRGQEAGRGPGRARGSRWRRAAPGIAALAGLAVVGLVGTAVLRSISGDSGSSSSGAKSAAVAPQAAGAGAGGLVLTDADLAAQIQQLLDHPSALPHPEARTQQSDSPVAGGAAGAATAPACVLSATGRTGPLAAAPGVYEGTRVFAVVYPDPAHAADTVDVYLVDTSCQKGVLLHRTLPRD